MTFQQAVTTVLKEKYADFNGRATRSEFWWYCLFTFLVGVVLGILGITILTTIVGLALLVPNIAVSVRRLHDTGRSGWWMFLYILPLIGAIALLIFFILDSTEDNEYGPRQ